MQSIPSTIEKLPLKFFFDLWSVWRLSITINKRNVDIIHTHMFKDAFIALFAHKFCNRHPRVILTRHLVKKGKTGWLYRWLYRQVDKIIFVLQLAKDEFLLSNPKIEEHKMVVVHNSVLPVQAALAEDIKVKYGISSDTLLLAFVGRLVKEKGVEILIEAIQGLPDLDFHLLFLGKGDRLYEQCLSKKVANWGLQVR